MGGRKGDGGRQGQGCHSIQKNPPKKIRGLGGFKGLVYILMSFLVVI